MARAEHATRCLERSAPIFWIAAGLACWRGAERAGPLSGSPLSSSFAVASRRRLTGRITRALIAAALMSDHDLSISAL